MNYNFNELIDVVKEKKSNLKITNKELSELSGVPFGTVNKILSGGTKSVKAETLSKLLKALGVSDNKSESEDNFGFVKVAAYTPEIKLGDASYNAKLMISAIDKAVLDGVELLVFPELSLTGSTLGDLFMQETLLSSSKKALLEIIKHLAGKPIVAVVGLPLKVGGMLVNSAAVISGDGLLGFSVAESDNGLFKGVKSVFEIDFYGEKCKLGNLVYKANEIENFVFACQFANDFKLAVTPLSKACGAGATITAVLSSNPETVGYEEFKKTLYGAESAKFNMGVIVAEAGYGESTTDLVFSGHNLIYENGNLLKESEKFSSGFTVSEIDVDYLTSERCKNTFLTFESEPLNNISYFSMKSKTHLLSREFEAYPFIPKGIDLQRRLELVLQIQSNALKRRIAHVNAKKLVIGVSGGLDSTLALIVAVRAMKLLGRDTKDIIAVTMPCFGTTGRTKNNAIGLSEGLNVSLVEINIANAVRAHFKDIGQDESVTDVTFENSQARERTQVLMDLANKVGGLVVGTGDLSELALGWATYNGDHMSNYGVNGGVPKTLIRYLVAYEAQSSDAKLKSVLLDILDTPVSPELVPPKEGEIAQKTEDIVGPYTLHDFYLYYAVRRSYKPSKIFYIAKSAFKGEYSNEELYKWLKNFYNRFFAQQFKRSCLPDGVKVGSVGFSPRGDFSMPSDAFKTEWLKDLEEIKL